MIEIKSENASKLKELLYETIKNAPEVADVEWINKDKYGFSRDLQFNVRGNTYKIKWYWNYSHLYFNDESFLIFDCVEVSSTWPNNFKHNLQFYYKDNIVAVIPIEEY